MNKFFSILSIIFFLFIGFYFRSDIISLYNDIFNPCSKPLTYSIGRLDSDFILSKEDFLKAIKEAEDLWEQAYGKNLFEYSKDGEMSINLIYDERQEGTDILNEIDKKYNQGKTQYENLQNDYSQYLDDYSILMQQRESLATNYNQRFSAYEKEVDKWNKKSSVPSSIYNQLTSEKKDLENLLGQIRNIETKIKELAEKINKTGGDLNKLANNINTDASKYNEINHSFEEEFEQGVYISSLKFKEINIYQFDNHEKLVRVLAHEMGHSLGIGHLNNPEDIMYSLNIGKNSKITKDDLEELNKVCSNAFNKLINRYE
jgi:predicted  nucleic acid-binding Zn-ribbon protein